jgi:putative ABC transport system ATP-binding protein
MILIKNLTKSFSNKHVTTHVLKGIDVHIKQGEFVAIMGKSGAGKSTLMYQMSLLDHPTSGSITLDGTLVDDMNSNERTLFRLKNLGYVFQDYALVPELTALENVMIPLLMRGLSRKEAQEIASEGLERIGVGHRASNTPSQLSGGEQQRVSIARAVAPRPTILFADEPTANLDNTSSQAVVDIFKKLHSEGQTIVMVTHEPEYTVFCDRIFFLDDGKIIREDTPDTLSSSH